MPTTRSMAKTLDLDFKLRNALENLRTTQALCDKLLQEREDSEVELQKIIKKNTELKNELCEQDIKYMDLLDQRDQLLETVSSLDQCNEVHEQTLNRVKDLERELSAAQDLISQLQAEQRASQLRETQNLYEELVGKHAASNTVTSISRKKCKKLARTLCHTITSLEVPRWADPRRDAELRCAYARQPRDPPLHSVKWYRDMHEIFRYTVQEPETRAFNTSGILIVNSSCDVDACAMRVRPERGTAKYTCEVSSEGPRFAVDRRSANMTLAVLPEYDPLITGLPTMVQVGEQALINCTSDYSLPAATIDWFVDSEPQDDPLITGETHISGADSEGLRASWRTLHVYPDDYVTTRGYLSLRCRATVPTQPPHVTSMSVRLFVATRPHVTSYMFSKNSNAASSSGILRVRRPVFVWTLALFLIITVPLL